MNHITALVTPGQKQLFKVVVRAKNIDDAKQIIQNEFPGATIIKIDIKEEQLKLFNP